MIVSGGNRNPAKPDAGRWHTSSTHRLSLLISRSASRSRAMPSAGVTVGERAWVAELDATGLPLDWRANGPAHRSFHASSVGRGGTRRREVGHDAAGGLHQPGLDRGRPRPGARVPTFGEPEEFTGSLAAFTADEDLKILIEEGRRALDRRPPRPTSICSRWERVRKPYERA